MRESVDAQDTLMFTPGMEGAGRAWPHQIGDDAGKHNLKKQNASSRNRPGLPADPCPSAKARRTAKVMNLKRLPISEGRDRLPLAMPNAIPRSRRHRH